MDSRGSGASTERPRRERQLVRLVRVTLGVGVVLLLALLTGTKRSTASGAWSDGEAGSKDALPFESAPGAAPISHELSAKLWAAYEARGAEYAPRTEHLRSDGTPRYVNRLILEDSPYLIQHAHNPVNWYPWGPEAFEAAKRDGRPIFLSIGYSTCHWCHVMEKESFENEETARLMNQWFVNIKVDREQRPDVDEVYMTAVQLITGRGGWPMSSFLTEDGRPFFGGTYFPRESFEDLLRRAAAAWEGQRPQLVAQAAAVAERVALINSASGEAVELGDDIFQRAQRASLEAHDDRLGGFSQAPKFPHEPELFFLLGRALRSDQEASESARVLAAVTTTLEHMAGGGIYDQVGGGFHRYSTDAEWLVPHFEKMLYNQAHLARAYLEASKLTGDELFERVARQTLDYVLRDLTSPAGAFYSATDADSEGREGVFFVWTAAELRAALDAEDAKLAIRVFGVSEAGNFEGRNILYLPRSLPEAAAKNDLSLESFLTRLDRIREQLYQARERRVHPLRDEKIVTAWNAMMITTLARAGEALEEPRYLEAAQSATDFLWKHNRRSDGRLWRAHLDGTSSVEASQNDYAYLAEALVTLYDVTADPIQLERAAAVADVMIARFWDAPVANQTLQSSERQSGSGGFFMSEDDHDGRLPVRPMNASDGAIPSGNSVAVRALGMLSARTGRRAYRQSAEAAVAAFSTAVRRHPQGYAYMLLGLDELLHGASGPVEYAARGVVRAEASLASPGAPNRVDLKLRIAEGWHVNSHRPLQSHLIGTTLDLAEADASFIDVDYPEGEVLSLGFQEEPVSVYRGEVSIGGVLEEAGPGATPVARLRLTVQACDDERCLRPETMTLEVPRPVPSAPVAFSGATD